MQHAELHTGHVWLHITEQPLDVALAVEFLRNPAAGGIDLFLGTTRQWTKGRETSFLAYEAYCPMAMNEMHRLSEVALARWKAERIVLWHRLGHVPLAEASVLIGVATAHRSAAFEATRYLIDTLKKQVPIWKKEHYTDGSSEWVQGDSAPTISLD